MRSLFDKQCEQVRAEIGRARRRVDRRARDLTREGIGGVAWQSLHEFGTHGSWLSMLASGLALLRWLDTRSGTPLTTPGELPPSAARWVDRWSRQIRVLATRYRRTRPAVHPEVPHE